MLRRCATTKKHHGTSFSLAGQKRRHPTYLTETELALADELAGIPADAPISQDGRAVCPPGRARKYFRKAYDPSLF